MLRTTRLLASALFVISVSVLGTRVGFGGSDPQSEIKVLGVEKRAACDQFTEWFIQARNTSTEEYFQVFIEATVFSGVPTNPTDIALCTLVRTQTFDLAPGECSSMTSQFPNPQPARPCDSACCKTPGIPNFQNCNTRDENPPHPPSGGCTQILNATAKVVARKAKLEDPWEPIPGEPTICVVGNSSGGAAPSCEVINTCRHPTTGNPNPYYKAWTLSPCQAGL